MNLDLQSFFIFIILSFTVIIRNYSSKQLSTGGTANDRVSKQAFLPRAELPCLYSYILTVSFHVGIRFAPHTVSSHSFGRTGSLGK